MKNLFSRKKTRAAAPGVCHVEFDCIGGTWGRIYCAKSCEPIDFSDGRTLLEGLNRTFNAMGVPRIGGGLRSMIPHGSKAVQCGGRFSCVAMRPRSGVSGRFCIWVQSRQSYGWQGTVSDETTGEEFTFYGMPQLLNLMRERCGAIDTTAVPIRGIAI